DLEDGAERIAKVVRHNAEHLIASEYGSFRGQPCLMLAGEQVAPFLLEPLSFTRVADGTRDHSAVGLAFYEVVLRTGMDGVHCGQIVVEPGEHDDWKVS